MLPSLIDAWVTIIGLSARLVSIGPERLQSAHRFLDALCDAGTEDAIRQRLVGEGDPGSHARVDDLAVLLLDAAAQRLQQAPEDNQVDGILEWLGLVAKF